MSSPRFDSKPWPSGPSSSSSSRGSSTRQTVQAVLPSIRRRPFLLFGLPFTITILGAAYGLSYLTQTRYEYNATKVQTLSKETELGMRKDRRKIDLRQEYWRLATGQGADGQRDGDATWDEDVALLDAGNDPSSSSAGPKTPTSTRRKAKSPTTASWGDDWEPKRIARPEGAEEWGVPSNLSGASYVEEANNMRDYQRRPRNQSGKVYADAGPPSSPPPTTTTYDLSQAGPPDARGNRTLVLPSGKQIVLGPDGKPCRACNSKLAFAEAMRGAGAGGGKASSSSSARAPPPVTMAGFATAATAAPAVPPACPPDVEELGRSSWDLIHSIAAVYPDNPSPMQREALFAFLKSLPLLYPCGHCAESLQEEYKIMGGESSLQKAASSKDGALAFTCHIHNEVNGRLGKKQWDCNDLAKLKQRWLDGGRKCL